MGLLNYYRVVRAQPSALRRPALAKGLRCYFPRVFTIRCLRRLTDVPSSDLAHFVDEIRPGGAVVRHIVECTRAYEREATGLYSIGGMSIQDGTILYALVRALRPAKVVETGTASGISTTFLLAALNRNQYGSLISIDLPFQEADGGVRPLVGATLDDRDMSPVPAGREPGWIVPADIRERWDLRLGDAELLLPSVLADCGKVGLFLHDSLHTREHMLFEFRTAWPYLEPGGVLASDDAFVGHDALTAFAQTVGERVATFCRAAFIRKNPA